MKLVFYLAVALLSVTKAQYDPNFSSGRTVMVHLFEWRWNDIAEECERFLGPYGYGGVQVSPPSENILQTNPFRPWSERYTPINYKLLTTRSGDASEFASMVRRCNNAGVRIYVDAVINHIGGSAGNGIGTGGSQYSYENLQFPYFSAQDFNSRPKCPSNSGDIEDYNDPNQYRNCRLFGLPDLNLESEYVRGQIADYMNTLINLGVAGFRIDAAKHMWPDSLQNIFSRLNNLPVDHGFPAGAKPFIVQEVTDRESTNPEDVIGRQYYHLGRLTEFKVGHYLGEIFRGYNQLSKLVNWGEGWLMHDDNRAFVFMDNHDNQRSQGGAPMTLTFRTPKLYKMAQAFLLAHPYGVARIISSYYWEERWEGGRDQNEWMGPPHAADGSTLPVVVNPDLTCGNGWICEHRWRQIFNMVKFRNVVTGTSINDWWDNGNNQIAFCRGDKGFIAINNENFTLSQNFQTCLRSGVYCDVISGSKWNNGCSGKSIIVGSDGTAAIHISNEDEDPVVAIHAESRLD